MGSHQEERKGMNTGHESTKQLNELIDHKCRQLGKTKTSKGSAIHLAEWMKSQLGNPKEEDEDFAMGNEPEPEIWSQEELKKRSTQLSVSGMLANRSESRCEEIDLTSERSVSRNTEVSHQSVSTSESQTTVKSNHPEKTVSVCRECHKTCLNVFDKQIFDIDDDYDDNWGGPLSAMVTSNAFPLAKSVLDPFAPAEPPIISVLPPTPDKANKKCTGWEADANALNNNYIGCNSERADRDGQSSLENSCPNSVPIIKKPHIKISEVTDGEDSEETPEGSLLSDEPPYRSLSSSGLRRFGTLNSLERAGSDDPLDDDDKTEEIPDSEKEDDEEDKIVVRTYPPEVAHSIRGWTARAGCFVAEKMAFFERLSSPDNTKTVRKTTFFERYLKPSGDNHLESPPEPGNTTSSSGRGEDEGETSGATSGEEVWGTPTSGGEFEEELVAESSALSFMESPHGSLIGTDDDTEQLMEDLLISLPMLAARPPGLPPRRRLEPLLEEDDTESSSAPCSPKAEAEVKSEQDRGFSGSQQPNHDNCLKLATSSSDRPLSSRKEPSTRPRIGTIDRALGIQSDEETDENVEESVEAPPSLLRRLGLRRNREECSGKSSRLNSLSGCKKVEMPKQRSNVKKYLSRLASFEIFAPKTTPKQCDSDESDISTKTSLQRRTLKIPNFAKIFKLGFLRGRKVEGTYEGSNSAAYGGKPLFKYLFNKDTGDAVSTATFPNEYDHARPNEKQLDRRFWKQLRRRRSSASMIQSRPPQVAVENGSEDVADVAGAAEESKGREEIKISSEEATEMNEVEQLGSDFVPVSKHSDIVEKLELKRKIRHDSILKKLGNDLNELNLKIEENVTISSEEVKAHIKSDADILAELLNSLNVPEVASYHESVFLDVQKRADDMKSHRLRLVHDLFGELNKMEDLRARESEKIFRSAVAEIEKNAYISSYELQYFVEHEALKMNQISLNNRRCFEDLKLKLVLGCEHAFKSFMDQVFCQREKWLRYNAQQALDAQKIDVAVPVLPEPEMRTELKGHELILQLTPDKCYNSVDQREWFRNVKDVMRTIDNYRMGIVDLFRRIRQSISKSMSYECDDVRRALVSLDVLQFELRRIQPIFFGTDESCDNTQEFEKFWQYCLKKVENVLKDVVDFLINFEDLWASHNRRLCESKILVLKAVENAEGNNRLILQDLEEKLNLNLDSLRQEFKEEKIEILYGTVVSGLDAIRDRFVSNYVNETSIVEEFCKMMDLEADILSSDMKEFINTKFPCPPDEEDEEDDDKSEFVPEIPDTMFGAVILDFSSRMSSLKFSKYEVNKDLECFSNNARDRLRWRAEEWSKNKIREMSMKYQMQLEMHDKRYERIRIQIYQVRLEEVRVHKQVYEDHKTGVDDIREALTREIGNMYERGLEDLETCKRKVASVIDDLRKEEKAEVVQYVQSRMIREKSDFINDFKSKFELIRGEIELRVCLAHKSNLRFVKSIKMFHENGNYDADEAKTYADALESIDREIGTEAKNMIKDVNKKESHVIQKATEIFGGAIKTLSQMYEELRFHSNVSNLIGLCEMHLRDLETNLQSGLDLFVKKYDSLVARHPDEKEYLSEDVDDAWINLIHSMCKIISSIFYEVEPPEWQGNADLDGGSASENGSSKVHAQDPETKNEKYLRSSHKADFPMKDFAEELFETSLLKGNDSTFVDGTYFQILHYMTQIQNLGSVFYKKLGNRSLIKKDLLQANYEDFGSNIIQTFRLFASRSERFWLKTIHDFLPLLARTKASFKIYIERRVREYGEKFLAALDNYQVKFTECLIENECSFLSAFQSFDNRLLPLHGHPRNKDLLESLQEEVIQKTAELQFSWEMFIKKFKNELKHFRTLFTIQCPEWRKLSSFYSYGENILFSDEMGCGILDYLDGVIEKRGFVKKREKVGGKEFSSNAANLQNPKCSNEILLNNDAYLTDVKQIIDYETGNRFLLANELHPDVKMLQKSVEFDVFAQPYIIGMDTRYEGVKELIKSKSHLHKEIIFDWLDKWKMNVAKVTDLYTVKYGHSGEPSEHSSESGLCQGTQNPRGNASPVWLQKTNKTEDNCEVNEKERCMSNLSLGSVSPGKRQSQIPVLSRNSPKPRGNRKKAASVDMISPKTVIISNGKGGQCRRANHVVSNQSRSPSPSEAKSKKSRAADKINGRSRSYGSRSLVNNTVKRTGNKERGIFETASSQRKKPAANNVNVNKSYTTITLCSPRADSDTPTTEALTPNSQANTSSYTNDEPSPADMRDICACPSKSKTFSDYDYNAEPCTNSECQQPHCSSEYSKLCQLNNITEDEPQLELLDLRFKDSESQLFSTVPGSAASSARKSASEGSLKLDDLQTPKTTIRTISGDELVFSSSMEFDIENDLKNNDLPNESEDTIKELLEKTEDDSFVKAYAGVHLVEDDAYEYDSEGTTDADTPSESKHPKCETGIGNGEHGPSNGRDLDRGTADGLASKDNWRSRDNEVLTDVHYRQFLYHPAVLRRRTREGYGEDGPRSRPMEEPSSFGTSDDPEGERGAASRKETLTAERACNENTPEEEERRMYDRLNMMQNSEYVLKEIKRERTKRERITGAVLRITAKFIHLLAIFNLWPGDNCQLLTSHALRYGR